MDVQLTLEQYLDRFSWSQAELCRQANVSEGVVRRALNGETRGMARIPSWNSHLAVSYTHLTLPTILRV